MIRTAGFFALLLCLLPACQEVVSPYTPDPLANSSYRPGSEPEPIGYPPITGPARVFEYDAEATNSSDPAAASNMNTRYVLYDDGKFALQSKRWGSDLPGEYSEYEGGTVAFRWRNYGYTKEAAGHLEGDLLHVQYPDWMLLWDYANGSYRLVR